MDDDPLDTAETREFGSSSEGGSLSAGEAIGEYRVLRLLGRGGMGEVYLAEHVQMHKQYAVKVLPAELSRDAQFISRFCVEARVMADLNHTGIVQVHHMGEDGGRHYLTMDYVEGPDGKPRTLEDELAAAGKLPEARVRELALQICDALEYAHGFQGEGVIHRDLKPANILLDRDGNVKVADFGLAKVLGSEYLRSVIERSIPLSMAGQLSMGDQDTDKRTSSARAILGTYDYMSPEQKAGGEIGPRSDVYSLGVMLYRMLTGRKPEGAWKLPSAFGCSKAWNQAVRGCLESEVSDRHASVAALRSAITRRKRPWLRLLAAAALLGLLAAAGYVGYERTQGYLEARRVAAERDADMAEQNEEQAAEIRRLISAAQEKLNAGELEAAGELLGRAEGAGAGDAKVASLREELESKVGERRALGVKIDADIARERVASLALDRGQGMGKRVDDMEKRWRLGNASYEGSRWIEASTAYGEATRLAAEVRQLADERDSALAAKGRAEATRTAAGEARAAELAKERWNAAQAAAEQARGAFESGEFAEAEAAWGEASATYEEAATHARAVSAYRSAKEGFKKAFAEARPEKLKKWGGKAWAEVDGQARLGAASVTDPLAGAMAYRRALEKLPAAVQAAKAGEREEAQRVAREEKRQAYEAAVTEAGAHERAERWRAAETAAEKAVASGWEDTSAAAALLARIKPQLRPKRGEVRIVDLGSGVRLELVWIEPGWFQMGSPAGEEGRDDDETPHRVELTTGFWLGKYEVTQEQWEAVMGSNPSHFKGARRPVETVSWEDCQAFIKRLNRRVLGGGFRLPTEAEWEYACRARTRTKYNLGDSESDLARAGWYGEGDEGQTHEVGQNTANAWGLYDMHGNVWEWCSDWYGDYAAGTVRDPGGPSSGVNRVNRGGSWVNSARICRSAYRRRLLPGNRWSSLGFRLARIATARSGNAQTTAEASSEARLGVAQRASPDMRLFFHDDFSGANADAWRPVRGDWRVEDGCYKMQSQPVPHVDYYTEAGDVEWKDYVFEARVRTFVDEPLSIAGRLNGGRGYVVYQSAAQSVLFFRKARSQWEKLATKAHGAIDRRSWHRLRLSFKGETIRYYLDGELMIEVQDKSSGSGCIALMCTKPCEYDDVSVVQQ